MCGNTVGQHRFRDRATSIVRELARRSFFLVTSILVIFACFLSIGRVLAFFPDQMEDWVNARFDDSNISIAGLATAWRYSNPVIEIDRVQFPEGSAYNVAIEVAMFESLIRNQFVARVLEVETLDLNIALEDQQASFDFLKLIEQIQTNFDWLRHTDELSIDATIAVSRAQAQQAFSVNINAVNQEGIHRYRANLRQVGDDGGTAEFAADAADTLLDLRTGDYQMVLRVDGLRMNLPLLTGSSRLPRYHVGGYAEWEMVNGRVQGRMETQVRNEDRPPMQFDLKTDFKQDGDQPARFRIPVAAFSADEQRVDLPDLVVAIDSTSMFGSTYSIQVQELVPTVVEFLTNRDKEVRWPAGIALRGSLQRLEFLLDQTGFHWYTDARDMASQSFDNLPAMQIESGSFFGNARQVALDAQNTPSLLFLSKHFDTAWQFASLSGFALLDARDQQLGLILRDFKVDIAPDHIELLGPSEQLEIESLLSRVDDEVQLNELIHEPVSARFDGSMRHLLGGDPNYRVSMLIASQNTLLPVYQADEFLPSNLVEDLRRWRQQYLDEASLFGTRVSYLTFRDEVFGQNERELHVEGHLTNGTVRYHDAWPNLTNVGGSWSVNDDHLVIKADRVTVQNTELKNTIAHFPLNRDDPFTVKFDATAKTQELLDFVHVSELSDWLPVVHPSWQGGGLVSLAASLSFPFAPESNTTAASSDNVGNHRVDFELHDTSLRLPDLRIEFHELNGDATWRSPYLFEASITRGRFFDQPMSGSVRTEDLGEQTETSFHLASRISAENAIAIAELQEFETGSGETDFEATLRTYPASSEATTLAIESDLDGIVFDTLTVINDSDATVNPSGMQLVFDEDRTELSVQSRDFNGWLTWVGTPATILEGAIALGSDATVPDLVENHLHLAGGLSVWEYGDDDPVPFDVPVVLNAVEVEQFFAFDIEFTNVTIDGLYGIDSLDVAIESEEFNGTIVKQLTDTYTQIDATKVLLSFEDEETADDPLPISVMSELEPARVNIDELLIEDDDGTFDSWGTWRFDITPTDSGVEIADLTANSRGLQIETFEPIQWLRESADTSFNGRFFGQNLSAILEAWDFDATVESEQFEVTANIRWPGSPLAIDIENASGQFQASARNGRIMELDQGADVLRLISLLNFSKILNRIALDFSDVTQSGLHYDTVSMAASIEDGLLTFDEPLRISGPSARLRIDGNVDTKSGELNNRLTVRIPLHKGLQTYAAYLAASNPAATVALLLGTLIISEPIKALLTTNYDLTGDLDNPVLTRVGMTPTEGTQAAVP